MYCSNNLFPFATIDNYKLNQSLSQSNIHYSDSSDNNFTKTCLMSSNLFNEINNFSSQQNNDTENIINCKYYNIDDIQNISNLNYKDALSLFHINAFSLSKNIEELEYLINKTKIDFDVIINQELRKITAQ